jgi:hypothetical protein
MGAQKRRKWHRLLFFLVWYHKDGSELLSHIIWVTVDETWVLLVNVEIKEQSEQWMQHIHQEVKKA